MSQPSSIARRILGEEIDRRGRRNATRRALRAATRGDADAVATARALGARVPRIAIHKKDGSLQCPQCLSLIATGQIDRTRGKCRCLGCGTESHL